MRTSNDIMPMGFMFRHSDIPKYIYVYANEFDNEYVRTIYNGALHAKEYGAIPGFESKEFHIYRGRGFPDVCPLDPTCFQILRKEVRNEDGIVV